MLSALLISACSAGSVVGKWERTDTKSMIEFTSDGKVVSYSTKGEKEESGWTYKTDAPGKITIIDNNINPKCVYKIEGSKMTMNCSASKESDFPKDFTATNGTQMTLERK